MQTRFGGISDRVHPCLAFLFFSPSPCLPLSLSGVIKTGTCRRLLVSVARASARADSSPRIHLSPRSRWATDTRPRFNHTHPCLRVSASLDPFWNWMIKTLITRQRSS